LSSAAKNNPPRDDRHAQVLKYWRIWKDLQDGRQPEDWTDETVQQMKSKALNKLADLCKVEIIEAVLENQAGANLRGLRLDVSVKHAKLTGDEAIILGTVRKAATTVTEHRNRPVHEHVKICMVEALRDAVAAFDDWFYGAEPQDLLPLLLSLPRAIVVEAGEYLNHKQRSGLRALLLQQLGNKAIPVFLDREPEEPRRWLHWYLWRLEMEAPEKKRALRGVPRVLIDIGGEAWPTNRGGEPLDPLAPVHAKVWQRLGRELNKHGYPIKDPESKTRLAQSFDVSRSTVDKFLEAGILPTLKPDGTGGVVYEATLSDFTDSIEMTRKIKRGRHKTNDITQE
jgi:hypothetical protein